MPDRYQGLRDAIAAGPTKGKREIRGLDIVADTREQVCCGQPSVGAEYMGEQELVCCGCPDIDGDAEEVLATATHERDAALIAAADPDTIDALLKERDALREVLEWVVRDFESGGVAKLRPIQERRARAALADGEAQS